MKKTQMFTLLGCLLAACTSTGTAEGVTLKTCVDYGCDNRVNVYLSPAQMNTITATFAEVDSAAAERAAIANAIAWFETEIGSQNGTWRDKGRNPGTVEPQGQLDCIAESLNTTLYLKQLQRLGQLQWHQVDERVVRHRMLFGTHWTAVIIDNASRQRYAVDSWYEDNGKAARIVPLEQWFSGAERIL